MTRSSQSRRNQRQRTHDVIIAAAIDLMKSGVTPSMAEIVEAARVSRRTVYLHFPTLDQLLTDARIGLLSKQAVDAEFELVDPGGDTEKRVTAMIDAIIENARVTLPLGRSLIKLTIETPAAPDTPRRGYRRVAWIEKALSPLRAELSSREFERLVSALSIVIGWEALIVLADVRALVPPEQRKIIVWTARAILRAALENRKRPKGRLAK
ncbi:MAG: TetR/AcrR family transcriptional regulator [Rhizomicrobium sp.]